jgi:hypothetical protein
MARTNSQSGSARNEEAIRAYWAGLNLSTRVQNVLAREGIASADQVRTMPDDAILEMKRAGKGVLLELRSRFGRAGANDAAPEKMQQAVHDARGEAGGTVPVEDALEVRRVITERAKTDGHYAIAYALLRVAEARG